MKQRWQSKEFEDCIEKVTYTTKIQRKDFLEAGAYPVVSQEDTFINGYWDDKDDVFRVETPLVVFGDHTKVLKYIDFDFVLGADGVKLLLPKEFLVPKFFYYQLQTAQLESLGYARHYKLLKELEIKFPERAEQHRIVAILDEAFDGIATAKTNAEKNLQNARALFESHLQAVFSQRGEEWIEASLGEIAQVKGGKRVPKGYKLLLEPTDYPYLRVTDFSDFGTIEINDLRYVSPEVHREIKNYIIYSTDLYISIAGTIGKTGIIPEELDGANLTENACRLVFNADISNRFVYYFTLTPDFVDQAGLNTRTAAQPKLALSRLATIRLGIPPIAEQMYLVREFDLLRDESQRLESLYQQKLAALDELKKSLLHQAFSGQL